MEDHVDRGVGTQSLDFAQPIEVSAVRAAAEAMIVVVIDVQARRVVVVEWAGDLAVDQLLADQVRERDAREPLFERLRLLLCEDIDTARDRRSRARAATGVCVAVDACGSARSPSFWSARLGLCSSSQVCLASPQLRPNFRSTRIGTSSCTASQPSRATSSACSRELTEQSRQSCICSSGTMPSRQHARIHSLVCRAAEPWISAFSAVWVSAR